MVRNLMQGGVCLRYMSLKKALARFFIVVALELLFLRHKFDLLEHKDHGDMGETFVYKFEAFRLYITNDRGDYYAQLAPDALTDIWKLSLILEYLGVAREGKEFTNHGLFSLGKELWLLSRNMSEVRKLIEEDNSSEAKLKLDQLEAMKLEQFVESLKRAAER
jgi:hypothetical protein